MFLLFVDTTQEGSAKAEALLARRHFKPVFEEIGDVTLIDTVSDLHAAIESGPENDNLLVAPFGQASANAVPVATPMMPVMSFAEQGIKNIWNNAVSILRPGLIQNGVSPLQSLQMSTSDQAPEPKPENPEHTDDIVVNWPLWNEEVIAGLRGHMVNAEKAQDLTDSIIDTQPDKGLPGGVIFAANSLAEDFSETVLLISEFIDVFRHNEDAVLRLCVIAPSLDEGAAGVPIQQKFEEALAAHGMFACRIVIVHVAHNEAALSTRFAAASFYLCTHDLSDIYDASGYFSAQTPLILPERFTSNFGLSALYALCFTSKTPRTTILKNAFHIARTAPDGYQQLRRAMIDNAREHFSVAAAVESIRRNLNRKATAAALPSIDARRDREGILTIGVGLNDYTRGGWIDHPTRALAPGFVISEEDVVVDVGCGGGGFSRFCAIYARELIFCDLDPMSLKIASQHIGEVAKCPVRGVLTDGEALDVETESADKVVCTEVLEHVDNPEKVMSELLRIGKPGALYLISVPDTISENLQKPVAPPGYFEKPNHIRIFERQAFTELVDGSGLDIISHEYAGFYSVFHWMLKWLEDPELETAWARLWKRMLQHKQGLDLKKSFDENIAKSQAIIARKPFA